MTPSDARPDTSPARVAEITTWLETVGYPVWAETVKALSAQLTEAKKERDALDSELEECGNAPFIAALKAQLAEAHHHLGTALTIGRITCEGFVDWPSAPGNCARCMLEKSRHDAVDAARAYAAAHHAGGET